MRKENKLDLITVYLYDLEKTTLFNIDRHTDVGNFLDDCCRGQLVTCKVNELNVDTRSLYDLILEEGDLIIVNRDVLEI